MTNVGLCGLKPLFFRRKPCGLEATKGLTISKNKKMSKIRKQESSIECQSFVGSDQLILMMEIQTRVLACRDIMDLDPCNNSSPLREMIVKTLEDMQRLYPAIVLRYQVSDIKGKSIDKVLAFFCRALKSVGESWMMNNDWVKNKVNFELPTCKDKGNINELGESVLATLDWLMQLASVKFETVVEEEKEGIKEEEKEKKESSPSPRGSSFGKLTMESPCSYSFSESSYSCSSSPVTPKSVLPSSILLKSTSPSISPLWSLRVQALGKLNHIRLKRLSLPIMGNKTEQEEIDDDICIDSGDDAQDDLVFDLDTASHHGKTSIMTNNDKPAHTPPLWQQLQVPKLSPPPPPPSPPPTPPPHRCPSSPLSPSAPLAPSPPPPLPILQLNVAVAVPPPPPPKVLSIPKEAVVLDGSPPPPLVQPKGEVALASPPLPCATSPSPLPPPPLQSKAGPGAAPPPPAQPPLHSKAGPGAAPSPPAPPGQSKAGPGAAPSPPAPPGQSKAGPGVAPPPPAPLGQSKAGPGAAPPPPMPRGSGGAGPPPPPLLGAGKNLRPKATTKLKRSAQLGTLYRNLKGKLEGGSNLNGKSGGGRKNSGGGGGGSSGQGMADALAEMTKRSSYFQQIEEDVQNYGKEITRMVPSISNFKTKDMTELIKFHREVESVLEKLTDESQVLSRVESFPNKKLEAIRMAAALFNKLNSIQIELQNWTVVSPMGQLLDRVERYFDKIKKEIDALDRTKDEESKKLKSQNIEFDFHILIKIKESMVDLSSNCMELALKEGPEVESSPKGEAYLKMLWRAFQFAFRVYTFAGGHDERHDRLTRELAEAIEAANRSQQQTN